MDKLINKWREWLTAHHYWAHPGKANPGWDATEPTIVFLFSQIAELQARLDEVEFYHE